jgi:PTH2 family peptidyl-tRNA hydrolase
MEIELRKEELDAFLEEHSINDITYFLVNEKSTVALICSFNECFERETYGKSNFGRIYGKPVYLVSDKVGERKLSIVELEKDTKVKQVIVMRKDLKMRRGKEIAQGSHASMKAIMDLMSKEVIDGINENLAVWILQMKTDDPSYLWLNNIFTKVVVYCSSEKELMGIYNNAKNRGIVCSLIQDAGRTEFNGVPTFTCCAIGPGWTEEINLVTGHLPLY